MNNAKPTTSNMRLHKLELSKPTTPNTIHIKLYIHFTLNAIQNQNTTSNTITLQNQLINHIHQHHYQ